MVDSPYASEAEKLWGNTASYIESEKRLKNYTAGDIALAKKIMSEATQEILNAMQAGLPADSLEAKNGAEAHRASINDWWYECSYEMHTNLAQMYIQDERFAKTYDEMAPGFSRYLHDAIFANALGKI